VGAVSLAALLCLGPPELASAQFAVFDATNLVQNTMSALNTLETTVNQMTQIANQITSLAHQVQNLTNQPAAMTAQLLSAYNNTWNALNSTWGSVNGLASNLTTVATRYASLFPNRQTTAITPATALTPTQILSQTQSYLNQVRIDLQGVDQVTAQVSQQQPALLGSLNAAVNQLNGASGTTQIGNAQGQLAAVQAQQLQQITTLLMAINQAQVTLYAQNAEMADSDAALAITVATTPPAAAAAPVSYYP
jgi:P-type conjugative transfer protein TrbJ